MRERAGVIIVGAGAAGLMTAIQAARAGARDVLVLDGARKLGAKILIAGGGRCNVTHDVVDETAFAGSSRNAIRKVLRRFDAQATIAFFDGIGVELKRETTGKLFPVTDSARSVLNALLTEARRRGVEIAFPRRVNAIAPAGDAFDVSGEWGSLRAARVVIATGGKSVPKSGSDGFGYELARRLGHSITPLLTPGLVPLTLPRGHFLLKLAGITIPATIELRSGTGGRTAAFTDSTLFTHFGLSGPSVMDISRYYLHALAEDSGAALFVNFLPGTTAATLERDLIAGARSVAGVLRERLPERLARALCDDAGADPSARGDQLRRETRRALVATVCGLKLPVTGSRGYNFAEVTAGGVPLSELHLETMESRVCPGLYLVGEICDVDGRIGGFNFQWAWSSGFVAGTALARNG
ncbi:MAG: NAD(P)/FAD-dependent oxidoreductase [Candidatus Krumholzibacteria bacterium]|nr:NAD(P)/FAD-dependent oxidoreductase [Candidatus Krumholzibacteria bacterium]MDH4337216.1 NAD(P)/FAD-dependent oxidoreductase [Candidatus Krumholzibacteria bacterium]MDH5268678.1 NAD(P)/FAD-dependent oxidoreductase [Candidatus Krumholzibacteria bacterium]